MTASSPLNAVTITMPARAVLTLLQLAGRAPLLDAERLWLEGIDREVAATLRAGLAPAMPTEPPAPPVVVQTPPTHPPSALKTHGIDSAEAQAAREARRAKRQGKAATP